MTEQENKQVELGLAAEKLMADPFFTFVMSELGNAYVEGITQSKPEQTPEREGFYHSIRAIQDITATLGLWVQVKEQIVAALNDNEEN
jgi:hypothetical protein